jgi:hypothetical protein
MNYFLENHSLETLRTLQWSKDLEFLKAILKVDGPARRTWLQLQRRLVLGEGKDDLPEVPRGRNDNEAGPSGMANDTVQ